jgi:hypothetical protein
VAFAVASTLVVALAHEIGGALSGWVPRTVLLLTAAVVAVLGAAVDVRSLLTGDLAPGIKRQTAEALPHRTRGPDWVVPVLWGLDTGLILTTFRVSCASYVMLVLAFLGLLPMWGGAAYGAAFAIPLAVAIAWTRGPDVSSLGGASFVRGTKVVQGFAAAGMAALALLLVPVA